MKIRNFKVVLIMLMTKLQTTVFRFWWLKINALGEIGDWVELEKFSKGKRAPVGMEVCFHFNIMKLGIKFLS